MLSNLLYKSFNSQSDRSSEARKRAQAARQSRIFLAEAAPSLPKSRDEKWAATRALQDLYPDSYRLLFTTRSFTSTASPFSNEPDVQRVQRERTEG